MSFAPSALALPHPTPLEPAALEPAALDASADFIEWLTELPFDDWLAMGTTAAAHRNAGRCTTARALLAAAIVDQHLNIAAWTVRDGVDTAAYYATVGRSRISRAERRTIAAARGAAEGAAVALLVGAWLPRSDRATLCAPFAACLTIRDTTIASEAELRSDLRRYI